MAYYLAVERQPNSYEAINVKRTKRGQEMFADNTYECTLEEIDKFSTKFEHIQAMAYELHNEKAIMWSSSPLAIVFVNGVTVTVEHTILFSQSKKYLENPELVVDYIIDKFVELDTNFFKELSLTLTENEVIKEMTERLVPTIENCIINHTLLETNGAVAVAYALVYNTDNSGKITYPQEINYSKLHKLVAFIADYEEKLKKNNEQVNKRKKYID